jgi:microcystin-dependent protein
MTVSAAPTALSYSGDDSTVEFAITWKYIAKAHVIVTHRDSSGTETTWTLGTQYTLSDADVDSGGTLTVDTAPVDYTPATGETLVIELEPPNTQDTDFPIGGQFPSSSVENELDEAAQRDQKLQTQLDRCMKVPKTDTQTGSSLELPNETDRASQFLAFDASGDPVAAAGTSADLTPVSTFINTLLDDADAATARATLGLTAGDAGDIWAEKAGDTFTGAVTFSDVVTLATTITSTLGHVYAVGDMIYSFASTRTGFLLCRGQTVGSAASGADDASDDYEELFEFIWANVADAEAAVSGGRGGTAQADWDADKTITLPDGRGRTLLGADNMGASSANTVTDTQADTIGDVAGAEEVTLAETNIPAHDHGSAGSHSHSVARAVSAGSTQSAFADSSVGKDWSAVSDTFAGDPSAVIVAAGSHTHTSYGGGTATNLMNPYLTSNLFIRY